MRSDTPDNRHIDELTDEDAKAREGGSTSTSSGDPRKPAPKPEFSGDKPKSTETANARLEVPKPPEKRTDTSPSGKTASADKNGQHADAKSGAVSDKVSDTKADDFGKKSDGLSDNKSDVSETRTVPVAKTDTSSDKKTGDDFGTKSDAARDKKADDFGRTSAPASSASSDKTGDDLGKKSDAAHDKKTEVKSGDRADFTTSKNEPEVFASTRVDDDAKKKQASDPDPVHTPDPIPSTHSTESTHATGRAEVTKPGGGDSLLDKGTHESLHERWQAIQLRFIDDPRSSATEAGALVEESLEMLRTALDTRKRELDGWSGENSADTERLRTAVRDYRELFDHIVGR
ncbi:hypothetical protein AB0I28_20285 [Phytomonospora sp. NPDC050363]|uniref:hypothetical protein n=1 Tax=Phytomonospora sp. NPDC050363 TaxID=3155642 RepID=UPI0033FAFDD6